MLDGSGGGEHGGVAFVKIPITISTYMNIFFEVTPFDSMSESE